MGIDDVPYKKAIETFTKSLHEHPTIHGALREAIEAYEEAKAEGRGDDLTDTDLSCIARDFEDWCALPCRLPTAKDGDGEYENESTRRFYACFEYAYKKGMWGAARHIDANMVADIAKYQQEICNLLKAPTQQPGWQDIAKPTEEMCDRARGFIMGLDLNMRTWGAMQKHLDMGGWPTLRYIRDKALEEPSCHITKWDVADCIYQLMNGADKQTDGGE